MYQVPIQYLKIPSKRFTLMKGHNLDARTKP